MTENYTDQPACGICDQKFNSDRERQEHEKAAHPRPGQNEPNSRQNHPPDQIDPNTQDQEEEKIA